MNENKVIEFLRNLADEIECGNHFVEDIDYVVSKTNMLQGNNPYYLKTQENMDHDIIIKTRGSELIE